MLKSVYVECGMENTFGICLYSKGDSFPILLYLLFKLSLRLSTDMAVMMAGAKIQEEMNNIPLADDDPQGELLTIFQ
jgi:hypothetical protein